MRPPIESDIRSPSIDDLQRIAAFFDPPAEIISAGKPNKQQEEERGASKYDQKAIEKAIKGLVERHPSTAAEIAVSLRIESHDAEQLIDEMVRNGKLKKVCRQGELFFTSVDFDGGLDIS